MVIKPFSKVTFECNSNKDYFVIQQTLEDELIPLILEKRLVTIIISYLFDEIVLFDSVLLSSCIDCRLEENGNLTLIKEIYISARNYGDGDRIEYQKITITPKGELLANYDNNFKYSKNPDYDMDSMCYKKDENNVYTFYTYNEEGEKQILAIFHDFDKKFNNRSNNFNLLPINNPIVKNKYIIVNNKNVYLMDTQNNTLQSLFVTGRSHIVSKLFQYRNDYLIICRCFIPIIIFGNLSNFNDKVVINLREVFSISKDDDISYYFYKNIGTSDERYIGILGHIKFKNEKKEKSSFICIIDISEKKIKSKLIKENPSIIWTINSNSVIAVTSIGKIIQYFL